MNNTIYIIRNYNEFSFIQKYYNFLEFKENYINNIESLYSETKNYFNENKNGKLYFTIIKNKYRLNIKILLDPNIFNIIEAKQFIRQQKLNKINEKE